jgi:peptide/nickel transport system substrate-binding protein
VAALGGSLWTATGGAPSTHVGGTLTVVSSRAHAPDTADPAALGVSYPVLAYVYDGLIGYKRVGGVDGSTLVPDLATSIPSPTDGGTTYTFQMRRGIRYSDGSVVSARDVLNSIKRLYVVGAAGGGSGLAAGEILQSVVGAPDCAAHPTHCDLSKGVVVDESAGTVTFHLSHPDSDFLFQLAGPGVSILPSATPLHDVGTKPAPATGPYVIAAFVPGRRLELVRNPRFNAWSTAQPPGYPDRIVWTGSGSVAQGVNNVEQGKGDYFFDNVPKSLLDPITTQYTQLAHIYPYRGAWAMYLNTRVSPFNDVRVRRALAFAVDRREVAKRYPLSAVVSCQGLVPNFPGYKPYCPYTVAPAPAGTWTAPDVAEARNLVAASHTSGTPVTIISWSDFRPPSEYVASVLRSLGYPTTVKVIPGDFGRFWSYISNSKNRAQAAGYWNVVGDPSSSELLGGLTCDSFIPNDTTGAAINTSEFCDPSIDRTIAEARAKQSIDPAAATALWTKVDRALVDEAPFVPMVIPQTVDLVSPRLGNYENNPALGMLLDLAWIK